MPECLDVERARVTAVSKLLFESHAPVEGLGVFHKLSITLAFGSGQNVKVDLMVNVKMATLSAKFVLKNA